MPDLTMCREIYNAKAPIDAECKSKYFYISINIYISMSRVRRHCVLSKCVCWHVHTYSQKNTEKHVRIMMNYTLVEFILIFAPSFTEIYWHLHLHWEPNVEIFLEFSASDQRTYYCFSTIDVKNLEFANFPDDVFSSSIWWRIGGGRVWWWWWWMVNMRMIMMWRRTKGRIIRKRNKRWG